MQLEVKTFTAARCAGDRQVGYWANLAGTLADKVVAPACKNRLTIDLERGPKDGFSLLSPDRAGSTGSNDTHVAADSDTLSRVLKSGPIAAVSGNANDLSPHPNKRASRSCSGPRLLLHNSGHSKPVTSEFVETRHE
ncbi:hypothetical protein SAMN05444149_106185 [Pseudosulfitobacter pseudonitzschiae]|uniref:Uncharacterized protein n=1 Tax=Pseudosulfitobacter pseudonitzschiae TaxID=1402135 RepID=A0A073J0S0_9RHOB|nr:hypothetical protein [Pseudosulfitobacter pseudonitzschiae]KEJ95301.1 hypothetical protein SUH3_22510 [Pseudosulfitobacter pseudonitzschiae]QKS11544.1 hypothetical protein HT745_23465 [Pseudosulfitobacter pseudonitzschiae]SHF91399.1 hypothetical protein SAMN05444149_106185 [Pseudosulfitobacter pseudonitzschiae]